MITDPDTESAFTPAQRRALERYRAAAGPAELRRRRAECFLLNVPGMTGADFTVSELWDANEANIKAAGVHCGPVTVTTATGTHRIPEIARDRVSGGLGGMRDEDLQQVRVSVANDDPAPDDDALRGALKEVLTLCGHLQAQIERGSAPITVEELNARGLDTDDALAMAHQLAAMILHATRQAMHQNTKT